jgi:hypothetical protein
MLDPARTEDAMPHISYLLLILASTLFAPSLIAAAPGPSATETLRATSSRADGGAIVQAQYITREQQQERAKENLERHRQEKSNSNSSVDRSSGTATGETYGREYLERQIQGDKPRVVRPY